jgi:tRNA nucleotidyltransferase (CCA-adding enzyme)
MDAETEIGADTEVEAGFEFVEGATSDLSFVAHGPTLEAAFVEAGRAFLAATVEEPSRVERRERRRLVLEEPDLELLLLRFLNELVYLRDCEELLLHLEAVSITVAEGARLEGSLAGEPIDRSRHALVSDVKAATAHGLRVERGSEGWFVTATLDV